MQRFIVVHTMPMTEEQGKAMMETMQFPPGLVCRWTYCDFEDGKLFCDWVAPSKQALEEYLESVSMPYDGVYPVRIADWALRDIEPARSPAAVS